MTPSTPVEARVQALKPCPFCGGEAEFVPYKQDGLTIKCTTLGCVRRDQRTMRKSLDWLRDVMTEDWNIRAEVSGKDAERLDAERYQWLRAQHWNENTLAVVLRPKDNTKLGTFLPFGDLLDQAIDTQMKSTKEKS